MLNEEILWELISIIFKINLFIFTKINKHDDEDEHYIIEFPEGYDLNKLYQYDKSLFVYKYINHLKLLRSTIRSNSFFS